MFSKYLPLMNSYIFLMILLQNSRNRILSYIVEIGFALFDSFALVNPFIAWRNQVLKDRPEKERSWVKYGVREARLKLITRWAKRASRHYEATQPHKKKRRRLVSYT